MTVALQKDGRRPLFLENVGKLWRSKSVLLIGFGLHHDLRKLAGGVIYWLVWDLLASLRPERCGNLGISL